MKAFLLMLLSAFVRFAVAVTPELLKQWREPKQVKQMGGSKKAQKEIDDDIRKSALKKSGD